MPLRSEQEIKKLRQDFAEITIVCHVNGDAHLGPLAIALGLALDWVLGEDSVTELVQTFRTCESSTVH